MVVYDDSQNIRLVQSIASTSSLVSSITGTIRDYIISKFPKHFFKAFYIDSMETVSAMNQNKKYNDRLNKVRYPSISVSPSISLDNLVDGMDKSPYISSMNFALQKDLNRFYNEILRDPKQRFQILYSSDYITVNFDFKIVTNKFIQNMDLAYYIKSKFQLEMLQYLNNVKLQTEFPKSFVMFLSYLMDYDLDNEDDMTKMQLFLSEASVKDSPILKKRNLSTSKYCFFFDEMQNILFKVEGLDVPTNVSREQQLEGEYQITFRVSASTWFPNSFVLSVDRKKFQKNINEAITLVQSINFDTELDSLALASSYNLDLKFSPSISYVAKDGHNAIAHMVYNEDFTFSLEKQSIQIYLYDSLKNDLQKVYNYAISNNLDLSDIFIVRVLSKGVQPNYTVDLYNKLSFKISEQVYDEFKIILYVNRAYIDSLKKVMKKDNFFFRQDSLGTIQMQINNNRHYFKVYSFKNFDDMKSEDISKCFRIKYDKNNIGYIGLQDIDSNSPNYNDYCKICVGYDNSGNPIIKALQEYKNFPNDESDDSQGGLLTSNEEIFMTKDNQIFQPNL